MTDGFHNLKAMFDQADALDRAEGMAAYWGYHSLMRQIAEVYEEEFSRVVAAFVAMSPNSDYVGNVRSLLSVLEALKHRQPLDSVTISTYTACKVRACSYLLGTQDFLETARGLKIRSFYFNITEPENPNYVTVDGHLSATWKGHNLTMKEAIIKTVKGYNEIANDLFALARHLGLLPNQVQAIIWLARKRVFNVRYTPQLDIFRGLVSLALDDLPPYRMKPSCRN